MIKHILVSLSFAISFLPFEARLSDLPESNENKAPPRNLYRPKQGLPRLQLNELNVPPSSQSQPQLFPHETPMPPTAKPKRNKSVPSELIEKFQTLQRRNSEPTTATADTFPHLLDKNAFQSVIANTEIASPRGPHPLSDLDRFTRIIEETMCRKEEENGLPSLEGFLGLSATNQRIYATPLGSSGCSVAAVTFSSINLFTIENSFMGRHALPLLKDQEWKEKLGLLYERYKIAPESDILIYIFLPQRLAADSGSAPFINLSLPCINKVGSKSTLHKELDRCLRSAALFTASSGIPTYMIDSFSRPNPHGLLHPYNGAADIIGVSRLLNRFYPDVPYIWTGTSWGGAAVDIAGIDIYYNYLSQLAPDLSLKKPLMIISINGLQLSQEKESKILENVLRINIHGTEDKLLPFGVAKRLGDVNGTHTRPVERAGHNPHMFALQEGEKLSKCLDFSQLCLDFLTLPTPDKARQFAKDIQEWNQAKEPQDASTFLDIPSLRDEEIELAGEEPPTTVNWAGAIKKLMSCKPNNIPYGASDLSGDGTLQVDKAFVSFITRIAHKILKENRSIDRIPAEEIQEWLTFTEQEKTYLATAQ